MRKILLTLVGLSSFISFGQLSGLKNIPGDYADLNLAITDLNTQGVGPGGVILNLISGNPQTAPAGGYSITANGGGVASPIQIIGNNNVITASAAHTVGNLNDAIFKIIGSDYVSIGGFIMQENAANTVTAAGTNTMTEWGVALLYASTTNGAQNCTIAANSISLNRSYQNTFGIYSNSTHSATTVTTSATATTATGGNSGLKIYANNISNVNQGILVVGPTAIADHNAIVDIGGSSAANGNTISNFGTTGTFSGFANVSGSVFGILVRNSVNINIRYNTITSSAGGTTSGALRGIYVPSFNNTPTVTSTTTVSDNTINLTSGAGAAIQGVFTESGSISNTSSLSVNNNNFTGLTHNFASSSAIIALNNTAAALNTNINSNTFTNISTNTSGSFTFISNSVTRPASAICNVNNNSTSGNFNKLLGGGTVTFYTSNGSTPSSGQETNSGNNFSNITVTGATTISGWSNTDGSTTAPFGPTKTITNNTFSNITGGSSSIALLNVSYSNDAGTNIVSGNTISNVTSSGSINGISSATANQQITGNTITGLTTTGASTINGMNITGGTTQLVARNKVGNLEANNASGAVNGITISGGTTMTVRNNIVGDLRTPAANATNPLVGINVTGGTTVNVYYNTVRLNGTSSGTNFGSSAISVSTTPTVDLQNNIFVNNSGQNGTGLAVAYRRSSTTLTSYASAANRNDFIGASIYTDGTNTDATLAAYQIRVAPRDANSISTLPNFVSTTAANSNFLHIDVTISTPIESGAANIAGVTIDFDNDIRQGNAGYSGTGTAPDMGADEFELAVVNCSSASGGTIATATGSMCVGATKNITSTGATTGNGITYQWKVSSTSGGPYTNVSGGLGATTTSYTTSALPAGTYYFVLETTCQFGPITGLSNEYTLTVNSLPTVVANPATATYCIPGTGVSITGSGANTYAWSPSTGLSATTGTTVVASPIINTTYTVTGTDVNGCIGTTTSTITVAANPVISSVTATPSAVCSGNNSQLQVTAATVTPVRNYAMTTSTGGTLDPMVGATTVLNSSNDDTPTAAAASIGFTFNYNGTNYTQYSISPDGWILLGGAVATSEFTNAVTSTTNVPKIYPYWDDMATGTDGNVKTLVIGSAPNRIFIAQWFVTIPRNTTGAANSTFQTWLYETTNVVEFHYGTMGVPTSGTISSGLTAGASNFNSITFSNNSASGSVANDVNATAPASGRVYTLSPAPQPSYVWTPSGNLSNATIANPIASNLTSTTAYSVQATSGACSATGNVSVTVNPLPTAPTATNSAQCGTQVPTASVASTTGLPTPTFVWYDAPTAGTVMQSSTSTTYTSNVTATTTFYVAELNTATGCEGARTAVTITVSSADAIQASVDNATICIGSSINLSVVNTNPTPLQNYTYTWSGTAGSGLTSQNGSAITVTPTAAGTYTFDVNGVDGSCSGFSSVNVTVNPFTSVITPIMVSCNGVNNGSFAQGATSCGTAASWSVNGGPFGPIPTNLTAGTYSVVTMNTLGFTSAPQNITVTTNVAPTISIGGSAAPVCPGTPVAMTATSSNDPNYTYTWSNGLGSGAAVSASPTSTTTYTVTGTDLSGGANNDCIATATFTITVNPVPTGVTASANDNLICVGEAVTLTSGPSSTPVSLLTQNFDGGLGSWTTAYTGTAPATTAWTIQTAPYSSTGSMTFTNFATPQGGNFAMSNADLGSSGLRTRATLTSPSFSTVGMNSATLTFQNLYQRWASGDSAVAVQVSINGGTTWTNLKEYFAIGTNQGTTTNSAQVPANETITLGAGLMGQPNVKIRYNYVSTWGYYWLIDNIQLTGIPAPLTYAWTSSPAGYTSSSQNPATPVSPAVTTTYTMTATNAFGCSTSASTTVTVNALPTVNAGTDQTVCSGTSVTLNGSGTATGYAWNNGVTDATPFTATATTTYTVTGTDGNGCQNTDQVIVNVNALPTVNAGTDQAVCNGSSVTLTGSGATSYAWNNGITNATPFTATATTTYTVTGTDGNGCQNTDQVVVTVNNPTTGTDTQVACGSFTWINGVTYTASNNTATHTIVGGNANGCDSIVTLNLTINQPTSSTVTVSACSSYTWAENGTTYTTSGSYPVVLAGANANGCDSTVTLNLTINQPTSSIVTVSACGSYTWAENGTTYTTSGSYPVVLTGANANGCDSTVTLNLTINQPTSSTVTATACDSYTWAENGTTYTTSGSYPVVLAGANANGCDSTITLNLTINNSTTGTDVQTACGTYTWIDGVTYTSSNNTATFTLMNAAGCDSIVTLNLTINPIPTATATDNGDATITASAGTSYQWVNCTTGLAVSGANAQTFAPSVNGSYAVVVTNASGCSDTSACVNINNVDVKELSSEYISVYPNPTHNNVTITMTAQEANVVVVDGAGKTLKVANIKNGDQISLEEFATGVYFLNITTEFGTQLVKVSKN